MSSQAQLKSGPAPHSSGTRKDAPRKPCALLVDDDRVIRMAISSRLEEMGLDVREAVNGQDAYNQISQDTGAIDIILLDREMPVMTGMELVKKLKSDDKFRRIPVIMQTGSDKPEQIREGIDAGVFYYLTKPVQIDVLRSVVNAALEDARQQRSLSAELQKHKASFYLIDSCKYVFRTLAEAEQLASFIANCFPDPNRVITGIAELLVNAVEHGSLGITYEEKTEIIKNGTWRQEIYRREAMPENMKKEVEVTYWKRADGYYMAVKDEGPGFDWREYIELSPARASDNHGRGIAQARMTSFDKLSYNEAGNKVTAFVNAKEELEW